MNNVKILPSLLAFAEVAKQQSFTRAAKQLGMSKSAVSQQIKRLETHTGQQLLTRHTRGMSLTSAGKKLLLRCELLQDQVNLAFEEINSNKETPSGVFALTIPHSCEKDIVIPALNQLCLEFPKIEPKILVTDEAVDLIQENMDVALYAGELKDSSYRALPIGSIGEIMCASPAYLQKHGQIKTLDDLYQHRWISTLWQNNTLTLFNKKEPTKKITLDIKYFANTNTLPSVLEMLLYDMGIALLPELVLKQVLASGQLVRVLPSYQGRQWPFYLVHRFQNEKPAHVARFYQLVKHFFSNTY
ncbi:Transcriptional regulator, LysR family [hydrothermal vent metagenome]|uniref:Transcriptional regulator, LysR family n=1 Tax=hydrothermal vent metagenome TaxID=652676 RepID=A0A3B0WQB7_9ZZZZ